MAHGSIPLRHSPHSASSTAGTFSQTLVEYRKDGTISKMRCHKGNIPVLPQTKRCPSCPAKFTRTTHLNRHLRTHTGERQHRCETCDAQFTRSDLLTRHKKTCGDSFHVGRTRRRSCQACADSKVKCDLQQPCSKCQARGKECMFVIRSSRSSAPSSARPSTTDSVTERISDPVVADAVGSSAQSTPPTTLLPTSLKPSISPDRLDQTPFVWTSTVMPLADQAADGSGAQSLDSAGPSPSPSESVCFTSGLESPPTSGSASIENTFSSLYANDDLEPFFSIFSADNSAYLDYENMHKDPSLVSTATPSLVSSARSHAFIHDAQRHLQQSELLLYGQPSNEQAHIPPEHFSHRQRFVQGNYISAYSVPIGVRQQAFSEEQYYPDVTDPPAYVRNRVRAGSPYQGYESMRRVIREGHEIPHNDQPRYEYPRNIGSGRGRDGEKMSRYLGVQHPLLVNNSAPDNGWSVFPETGRTGGIESVPHTDNDDQTYRSQPFVDPFRWSESYVMRRQLAGIDLA